ncbi:hypothetical protein SH661x_000965 [Planctomicrobium sp. SH661]|uniref:hypothetical protein n=1 Tax=Planctomicrobium sp. SH661 TaxID=3448124 RepID=UPI003F5BC65E
MKPIWLLVPIQFLIGFFSGALIWSASLRLTGQIEPWDSAGSYYWLSVLSASCVAAMVYPRTCWLGAVGVYLGQVFYIEGFYTAGNASILLASLSVFTFSFLPIAAGTFLGAMIGKSFKAAIRSRSRRGTNRQ